MKKFTLYIGLNDKDTKIQQFSTVEAHKIVNQLALRYFDGATVGEATGIYKHEDGTFVTENTIRVELMFCEEADVKLFVNDIKKILNQESVAVQVQEITSELW
jgi:hypothetical protein